VTWRGAEEPPSSFTQVGFVDRLAKAAERFGLSVGKRYLMCNLLTDAFRFDDIGPLVRLARINGWFVVLNANAQGLPAYAPEFNQVVAWHYAETPVLDYPCHGFVHVGDKVEPKLGEIQSRIPKYLWTDSPGVVIAFVRNSPHSWVVQTQIDFMEVKC
jgi:hypothetical protein